MSKREDRRLPASTLKPSVELAKFFRHKSDTRLAPQSVVVSDDMVAAYKAGSAVAYENYKKETPSGCGTVGDVRNVLIKAGIEAALRAQSQVTDEQMQAAAFDYCKWPKEDHSRIAFHEGAKWALFQPQQGEPR
jgi:hypothetical protein